MAVHYSGIMLYSSTKTNVTNFLSKTSQNRIILNAKKKNYLNKHNKESTLDRCLLKASL